MTIEIKIASIDVDGFTFTLDESNFVDTVKPSSSQNIPIDTWDRVSSIIRFINREGVSLNMADERGSSIEFADVGVIFDLDH